MLDNPEAHFLNQRGRQVRDLSETPESLRTDQFLTKHLEPCRQVAARATRLKKADEESKAKIARASKRLNRLEEVMVGLHERTGPVEFADEARVRMGGSKRGPAGLEGVRHE